MSVKFLGKAVGRTATLVKRLQKCVGAAILRVKVMLPAAALMIAAHSVALRIRVFASNKGITHEKSHSDRCCCYARPWYCLYSGGYSQQ
jgi:hypothetical protein